MNKGLPTSKSKGTDYRNSKDILDKCADSLINAYVATGDVVESGSPVLHDGIGWLPMPNGRWLPVTNESQEILFEQVAGGAGYACHEPECLRTIGRAPDQLPYDELLIRELDEAAPASCGGCDSAKPASHHCGKCAVLICSVCVEAHKTNPLRLIREHPLTSIADFRKQRAAGDAANPPRCPQHADEPIKMFCNTCSVAICFLCATIGHKGGAHEIVTLESAFTQQKQAIATLADAVETSGAVATEAASDVSNVREELEGNIQSAKELVEAEFRLISAAALRSKKAHLAQIDSSGRKRVKELTDQTTQLEHRASAAAMSTEVSLKLVTGGNQFELLQAANVVVSGMTELVNNKPQHEPIDIPAFIFRSSAGGVDVLVKAIEAYGEVFDHGYTPPPSVTAYTGIRMPIPMPIPMSIPMPIPMPVDNPFAFGLQRVGQPEEVK